MLPTLIQFWASPKSSAGCQCNVGKRQLRRPRQGNWCGGLWLSHTKQASSTLTRVLPQPTPVYAGTWHCCDAVVCFKQHPTNAVAYEPTLAPPLPDRVCDTIYHFLPQGECPLFPRLRGRNPPHHHRAAHKHHHFPQTRSTRTAITTTATKTAN